MSDLKASIEDDVAVLKASMDELKAVIAPFSVVARLEFPGLIVTFNTGDGDWIPVAELGLGSESRVTIRTTNEEYRTWTDAFLFDSTCRALLIKAVGWKNTREPGTPGWDGP